MGTKSCSLCGESFDCGADSPGTACWCADFPPIMQPDPEVDCRCPKCLKAAIVEKIEEYTASITPETAHASIARKYASDAKLVEDIDYYVNEDGLLVFTKWYLLKRGFCCKNGCRHCPYGFTTSS
ncbi:MAG: hypothetical protein IPM25_08840 [Chloracidobacterium sp.]|nr:hypothetical protein [Chloracidobacterium sp.]